MSEVELHYDFDAESNGYAAGDDTPKPQRYRDTKPDLSDPTAFVTELSAAAPLFQAEAVALVRVGQRHLPFKIRSVAHETLQDLLRRLRPKGLRRIRDKKTGEWRDDPNSPLLAEYNLRFAYAKVILGLADITLRDQAGTIVWQSKGEIQNLPKAITALRAMQLAPGQIKALSDAIDALSESEQDDEQDDLEDFLSE